MTLLIRYSLDTASTNQSAHLPMDPTAVHLHLAEHQRGHGLAAAVDAAAWRSTTKVI